MPGPLSLVALFSGIIRSISKTIVALQSVGKGWGLEARLHRASKPHSTTSQITGLTRWGFGGGFAAPENSSFWPASATFVADAGQKRKILEGLRPSKPPRNGRSRNSYK